MRLYLNDTGILTAADAPDNPTAAAYRRVIDGLKKAGAPLGGIGFQCHASMAKFAAPENVLRELDRFAVYGVPLKITEYDFRTTDEALAADYLRDILGRQPLVRQRADLRQGLESQAVRPGV